MSDTRLALHVLGEDAKPFLLPESGMLVVGSSADRAGLLVAGQGVDDAHCAIGPVKGGGWAIKDLGSRYGTFLNGKKVSTARLGEGDTILLGSRRLRVFDPLAPPEAGSQDSSAAAIAPEPDAAPPASDAAARNAADEAAGVNARGVGVGIPKRIGGYRIDRLLGRGAMGTVLLAEQESLHRPVALKLLPPRLAADQSFVQRFQKEARAAAALNHPNVVVVHDVGEADGFHFLSMEYMERGSLEDRLRSGGRLPWREVLDVLHDAARGLMFAEEKRIIHRDIKPANLMQNAAGTIKIADLGLATSLEAEASESEGKKILGTPHFIAPEQARGGAIDHRADLYSLGATAYHLLAGRTPFEGETTRDILRGHLTVQPEPLSTHVPAIPADLDALVLRLLAKDPDARPQSADALLADVDRLRLAADHGVVVGAGAKPGAKLPLVAGGLVVAGGLAAFFVLGRGGGDGAERAGDRGDEALAADGGGPVAPQEPTDDATLLGDGDEGAGAGGGGASEELEAELRERNLLAENAYLRIDAALDKEDRVLVLAELVAQYPGTDTASRAEAEIGALQAEIAAAAAAEQALAVALRDTESRLRTAAALPTPEGELPRPGDQLRAVRALPPPAGVDAAAARALAGRIENEIVALAVARFGDALERVEALAAEGRFGAVEDLLHDLLPRFDLPNFGPGTAPAGLDELRLQGDTVRGRLNRLAGEQRLWYEHRSAQDRAAIAASMRGGGALRTALAALDLDAALGALAGLEARLGTDEGREFATALRDDLEAAQAAIDGLAEAFRRNEWRRRSVFDPRGGKATPRDAAGIDRQGLHVDVKGAVEIVPWEQMAQSTDAVVQLFKERLQRDYTDREKQGTTTLLRVTCALEAADLAAQVLDLESGARFSAAEGQALRAQYAAPEGWVQSDRRFAREREAADVLAQALSDLQSEIWSAAEAGLARLLSEYADTLLVALLSDGGEWREDEPAAAQDE